MSAATSPARRGPLLRRLPPPAGALINPQYNFLRLDYWFGQVESRPLSLFRIFFGLLVLKNALYSIPLAQLFYSDEGIVPRAQFHDELLLRFATAVAVDAS